MCLVTWDGEMGCNEDPIEVLWLKSREGWFTQTLLYSLIAESTSAIFQGEIQYSEISNDPALIAVKKS